MYQTVYETSLLQEGMDRGVEFTPVGGIRSAAYGDPALKMVPAVITAGRTSVLCGYWTGAGDTASALCWGKSARIR